MHLIVIHLLPLLGNVLALRNERLALLQRISYEFGDIGAFHFGPHMVPVLNSPELIRQALVEQEANFEKTATVRALGTPVLGNGVFFSEGEEHRRQRKLLAPLFQHRHVQEYAETMITCTSHLQEEWADGKTLNIADEMTRLTLWIIGKILFGADISGEESELGEVLTYTFRHFTDAVVNPLRLPQSWPTPQNRRARQAIERINATLYRLIEARRQSGEERGDFLSMLLHAQDEEHTTSLSNRQIRDEALGLFVAGHETTANALTWCWYLLSQHPEIYARMQAEGDRVLAGRVPTLADLPNLPYTLQVFKETLRLYPPVYASTRRAISSVRLGGYRIPKGASVVIKDLDNACSWRQRATIKFLYHQTPGIFQALWLLLQMQVHPGCMQRLFKQALNPECAYPFEEPLPIGALNRRKRSRGSVPSGNALTEVLGDREQRRIAILPISDRYSPTWRALQMTNLRRLPITWTDEDRDHEHLTGLVPFEHLLHFPAIVGIGDKIIGTEQEKENISRTPGTMAFLF
jgi:cytochrome P450